MKFGDIVGRLLQQGMSGASQGRLQHALGKDGLDGLDGLIGRASSERSTNPQSNTKAGGLNDILGSLLGGNQGVVSNAQVGGIGALAGSLLGGGSGAVKGALGGSAMAILGSLALSALQDWQQSQTADGAANQVSQAEIDQVTAPQTEELCLKGMLSAAKADGQIQEDEMKRILGKLEEGGITTEERQFVLSEMNKPLDLESFINEIPNQQIGAQVYAASLLAITVDTESERNYMRQLAAGLNLNQQTVALLHRMVGAPAI
ncbi:MAG: protein YebE [Nitrosomonas sp.]|nr:MAG: protein YebE [Nitrosomonas sp.]